MNNFEYERSFNVKFVSPYIEYCETKGFKLIKLVKQNRIVFENKINKKLIARLTTETVNNKEETVLDCKNVESKQDNLNQSIESQELKINKEDIPAILSILNVMNFAEVANNLRKRYVYEKDNVKFEIDEYIKPQMTVVAIEGERKQVEKIYNEVKTIQ